MITSLNAVAAAEHVAELRSAGERWHRFPGSQPPKSSAEVLSPPIALRLADAADGLLVHDLAEMDDAPALEGPVLLAMIDGEAVAALSLRNGRVVSNPFAFTQEAVALLRLRAEHASRARRRRRRRRAWTILRPRLA